MTKRGADSPIDDAAAMNDPQDLVSIDDALIPRASVWRRAIDELPFASRRKVAALVDDVAQWLFLRQALVRRLASELDDARLENASLRHELAALRSVGK